MFERKKPNSTWLLVFISFLFVSYLRDFQARLDWNLFLLRAADKNYEGSTVIERLEEFEDKTTINFSRQFQIGRIYLRNEYYDRAFSTLKSLLEGYPESSLIYADLIRAASVLENNHFIVDLYETMGSSVHPTEQEDLDDLLALAYMETNEPETAYQFRSQDIALNYFLRNRDWENAKVYEDLIVAFPSSAINPTDKRLLNETIAIVPDLLEENLWDEALTARVVAYWIWQNGDLPGVEELLRVLITRNPDQPRWQSYLRELHQRQENRKEVEGHTSVGASRTIDDQVSELLGRPVNLSSNLLENGGFEDWYDWERPLQWNTYIQPRDYAEYGVAFLGRDTLVKVEGRSAARVLPIRVKTNLPVAFRSGYWYGRGEFVSEPLMLQPGRPYVLSFSYRGNDARLWTENLAWAGDLSLPPTNGDWNQGIIIFENESQSYVEFQPTFRSFGSSELYLDDVQVRMVMSSLDFSNPIIWFADMETESP